MTAQTNSLLGHGDSADHELWPWTCCRYVQTPSYLWFPIVFTVLFPNQHCCVFLLRRPPLQATKRSAGSTSRERSTWTRWQTTTTRASSSATRTPPRSTWWCGNRQSKPTGRLRPSGLWQSREYSSRWGKRATCVCRAPPVVSISYSPLILCGSSDGEVGDRPRWASEELPVAHRGHRGAGPSPVERPKERRLEGQGVLPLVPPAPTTGWIHQVQTHTPSLTHIDPVHTCY